MKTYVINLIGGPGCGKSLMSCLLFSELKIRGYVVEYAQEYVKKLIWKNDIQILNNQHYIITKQYKLINELNNHVEFIITDSPILLGLYYNRHNKNNICDIQKTEEEIKKYISEFNNINVFIERGLYKFEQQGRIHTEDESKNIDIKLLNILDELDYQYSSFKSSKDSVNDIINYIFKHFDP